MDNFGERNGGTVNALNPNLGQLNKAEISATKILYLGTITTSWAPVITVPEKKTLVLTNLWAYATTSTVILFRLTLLGGAPTVFFGLPCDTADPGVGGAHVWGAQPLPAGSVLEAQTSVSTAGLSLVGTEIQPT